MQFRRSLWPVSFGRKDGRVSLASEANATLPSPAANFATLRQQFQSLGLDVVDLVALSGHFPFSPLLKTLSLSL